MRCLLSLSLCLYLFTACSPRFIKGYRKGDRVVVDKMAVPPILQPEEGVNRYNMTFDFRKNHFSGMLLIKQTEEDRFRLLFNSHFGLSLFDIEIGAETFEVHQCVEPMRNKHLLKLLQRDFTLLLGIRQGNDEEAISYLHPDKPEQPVWKLTTPPVKGFYMTDTEHSATEMIMTGSGLGKTLICRTEDNESQNAMIRINHCRIRLILTIQPLE